MSQSIGMSGLLSNIQEIDQKWLIAVNQGLAHPWMDPLMQLISSRELWLGLTAIWLAWSWYKRDLQLIKQIIFAAAILGLADYLAAQWLKPYFGRPRPCQALSFIRVVSGCSGFYGFPSNHAVNGMVVATIMLGLRSFKIGLMFVGIALSVGFSRMYLGVHYPFDILLGFLFGAAVATGALLFGRRFFPFLRTPA